MLFRSHAGGNTYADAAGVVRPSFPNARYVVQAGEHHWATHTNERTAASYFGKNWDPIIEEGRFDFIEGDREIIELRHTGGMGFRALSDYFGEPLGTLLARHHRALRKLRSILEELGVEGLDVGGERGGGDGGETR